MRRYFPSACAGLLGLLMPGLPSAEADAARAPFPPAVATWKPKDWAAQQAAAVAMKRQVDEAIARGEKHITIPPGNYRFHPDALPNFLLENVEDVAIDAQGVTFWLFPFQRLDGVKLDHCRNVTIRGLTVDYYPTAYPQGEVTAIDPEAGFIDFRLDPGFSSPFDVPGHDANAKIVHFDPEGHLLESRLDWVDRVEDRGSGIYRVFPKGGWAYKMETAVRPGTLVALADRTMRMAFALEKCASCTLEDVTVYATPHMALTEGFGDGGNIYRRCRVVRRPETSRLLAANADVFHSIGVRHGPLVEDCEFSFAADDLMNIHGFLSLIFAQRKADNIEILSQVSSEMPVGTKLQIFDPATYLPKAEAVVVKSSPVDVVDRVAAARNMIAEKQLAFLKPAQLVRLQLDRKVAVSKYDLVTDDARVARGTVIRNNQFHDCYTRGLLFKGSGAQIEGNVFRNIGICSIGISVDPHFMEGPFPARIVIRDNQIFGNGAADLISRGSWNYHIAAIAVTAEAASGLPLNPTNFKIEILGNRIVDSVNCGILVTNSNGVKIAGNIISGAMSLQPLEMGGRMGLVNPCYAIVLARNKEELLEGNRVENPGPFALGELGVADAAGQVRPQALPARTAAK